MGPPLSLGWRRRLSLSISHKRLAVAHAHTSSPPPTAMIDGNGSATLCENDSYSARPVVGSTESMLVGAAEWRHNCTVCMCVFSVCVCVCCADGRATGRLVGPPRRGALCSLLQSAARDTKRAAAAAAAVFCAKRLRELATKGGRLGAPVGSRYVCASCVASHAHKTQRPLCAPTSTFTQSNRHAHLSGSYNKSKNL